MKAIYLITIGLLSVSCAFDAEQTTYPIATRERFDAELHTYNPNAIPVGCGARLLEDRAFNGAYRLCTARVGTSTITARCIVSGCYDWKESP